MNPQNPFTARLTTRLTASGTEGRSDRQHSAPQAQSVWSGPWPGVAGALAVLALLLAFSHVVNLGVQQGELRRQQMARQAMQRWRCDVAPQHLPGSCATELGTADRREAAFLASDPPGGYTPNSRNDPNNPKNFDDLNRPDGQVNVLQVNP